MVQINTKIPQDKWHQSQRGYFAGALYNAMVDNKDIFLVVGDLGYLIFDKIRDDFPDRFLNTGAAEQACADICVGLALEGKIPFMYTITPFYYRCFETIRTYINHEKINVKLIGSGRDKDYEHDGFSHDATDIPGFFNQFDNLVQYYPETKEEIPTMVNRLVVNKKPSFVSLRR